MRSKSKSNGPAKGNNTPTSNQQAERSVLELLFLLENTGSQVAAIFDQEINAAVKEAKEQELPGRTPNPDSWLSVVADGKTELWAGLCESFNKLCRRITSTMDSPAPDPVECVRVLDELGAMHAKITAAFVWMNQSAACCWSDDIIYGRQLLCDGLCAKIEAALEGLTAIPPTEIRAAGFHGF